MQGIDKDTIVSLPRPRLLTVSLRLLFRWIRYAEAAEERCKPGECTREWRKLYSPTARSTILGDNYFQNTNDRALLRRYLPNKPDPGTT